MQYLARDEIFRISYEERKRKKLNSNGVEFSIWLKEIINDLLPLSNALSRSF